MNDVYHPEAISKSYPDTPACIEARTGAVLTYAELNDRSNQIAHLFRDADVIAGDVIAVLCENHPDYYPVIWAAQRAGLYFVPISWHSTPEEAAYILENSEAKMFIASASFAQIAIRAHDLSGARALPYSLQGDVKGFQHLDDEIADKPTHSISDQSSGREMLYTSGTTGNPKAVKFALPKEPYDQAPQGDLFYKAAGYKPGAIILAPGPAYHASPLLATMAAHRFGATVLIINKFDAETCLSDIQSYGVTHMICVPTHFLRMLKLPDDVRLSYDVSSLEWIVHTAAPCPVEIKKGMIDWVGPIITEIYSGTERIGGSIITSEEWLKKPGSIGRAPGNTARVVDETTWTELPTGETGVIYFTQGEEFAYHNDPSKTKSIQSPQGWRTLGDIGRIDEDGFIFLTDRKSNMIISGGVNIYPQEVENRLLVHPKVSDAAVFGIPNVDFGEEVKAVVSLVAGIPETSELEEDLIAFCKKTLMSLKCPRSIDFLDTLPREENGKLYKSKLIEAYSNSATT